MLRVGTNYDTVPLLVHCVVRAALADVRRYDRVGVRRNVRAARVLGHTAPDDPAELHHPACLPPGGARKRFRQREMTYCAWMASSVVELAREVARPAAPERALAALAELRARLDELEDYHVEAAVARGVSWQRVGAALRVTKQAAHKRHAARIARGGVRRRGRMTVTGEARRAVRLAREEVAAAGLRTLTPSHILLGLVRAGGEAQRVLAEAGATAEDTREAVGLATGRRGIDPVDVNVSARARAVFEAALVEAVELGDDRLADRHVLLALLGRGGAPVRRALDALGVDAEAVRRSLGRD